MGNEVVLDLESAFERIEGDRELFQELVELLFSELGHQVPKLKMAIETADASQIEQVAHSMKSALANVGALAASALSKEMEFAGRAGDLARAAKASESFVPALTDLKAALIEQGFSVPQGSF